MPAADPRESRFPPPTSDPTPPTASEVRRVSSSELLGAAHCLVIEHGGREYRLTRTRSGKLILTA
jgi:hemin uptake protein HemP